MKLFKTLFLTALLATSASSSASVIKSLFDTVEFNSLMSSKGYVNPAVVKEVGQNVRYSLQDISKSGSGSPADLKRLKKLITTKEDKAKYSTMMKYFSKDASEISSDELQEAINNLVFLSQRYGLRKQAILACAPCVNKEMSDLGFEFTLSKLTDNSSKAIFAEMSRKASTPKDAAKYLSTAMKDFGGVAKVKPHEVEALMYHLMIPKNTSDAGLTALHEAINKVSKTKSGKIDLMDEFNNHKFYNIYSDKLSRSDISMWTTLLEETSKIMDQEGLGSIDAFYKVLERRADNVADEAEKSDLLSKLNYIKSEGCFARK